jgi:hypothetical protein
VHDVAGFADRPLVSGWNEPAGRARWRIRSASI